MDKFMLLPHVKDRFNTSETLKGIMGFSNYGKWGFVRTETIGDRGLLFHVKIHNFVGSILVTYCDGEFYVRKVNKIGMVMLTNHTKYLSILSTIFDLYLAD